MFCSPIFQTPIFLESLEGLTDSAELYEYIDRCEMPVVFGSKFEVIQTKHTLHKEKRLETFCEEVYKCLDEVCRILEYQEYIVEITEMWGNRQKPGTHFNTHHHSNNIFSGTFHLNEHEKFPCLKFFRPFENSFDLFTKEYNQFNQGSFSVPTKKDGLVIFPAWLTHCVDTNEADIDRLGISFNVMLRGQFFNTTL